MVKKAVGGTWLPVCHLPPLTHTVETRWRTGRLRQCGWGFTWQSSHLAGGGERGGGEGRGGGEVGEVRSLVIG